MGVIRFLLSLVAAAFLVLGLAGLLTQSSMSDSQGFAEKMQLSLVDPQVRAELREAVREQTTVAVSSAGDSGGILGSLAAGLTADGIADRAAQTVDTPMFAQAFGQWSLLLHQGLADYARGEPNDEVRVSGSSIEVGVGPLLQPILGGALTSGAEGVLEAAGLATTLTIDAGIDLRALQFLGALADAAWYFVGGFAGALLLVFLLGSGRVRWLGISLLTCAAGGAALAAAVALSQQAISPGAEFPLVGRAVVASFTAGWLPIVAGVAAGCALVGVSLMLLGRSPARAGRVAGVPGAA